MKKGWKAPNDNDWYKVTTIDDDNNLSCVPWDSGKPYGDSGNDDIIAIIKAVNEKGQTVTKLELV